MPQLLLDVCRLCTQKKKMKVDLFTAGAKDPSLLQKITFCLGFHISVDDILPKMVCFECQRNVDHFYNFKLKCTRAEEKLTKVANGLSSNKILAIVKEEACETDQKPAQSPIIDHTYFTLSEPTLPIHIVKKEILEDSETIFPTDLEDRVDTDVMIFEEIVYDGIPGDVKHPVIEIVYDNDVENFAEVKPVVEEVTEDVVLEKEVIDISTEFEDKDFLLGKNEKCDIDFELVEAEIAKKRNPLFKFNCEKCKKSFKHFKALRKHRSLHEEELESYKCHFCDNGRKFEKLLSLKRHILSLHLRKPEYQCDKCDGMFFTRQDLKLHIRSAHQPATFGCKTCGKSFKHKSILAAHQRVHSDYQAYVCEECGRKFRWPSAFRYHLKVHHMEKNFLCSECGNKFSTKRSLLDHLNIHSGARPFSCQECGQTFTHYSTLRKHESIHKSLGHNCSFCNSSFPTPFLLKQHETKHSEVRPFVCPTCNVSFRTQSGLCNHKKIHGPKSFKCTECGLQFSRSCHLTDHMGRHTGAKHLCPAPNCDKAYTQRYPLTKHFAKNHPDLVIISKKGAGRRRSNLFGEELANDMVYGFRYKTEVAFVT